MGLNPFTAFKKKWTWDKDVVNSLSSCRQYLDGKAPPDNARFQVEVTNRAIEHTLNNHPFFETLAQIDKANRLYGKRVEVEISAENWLALQKTMDSISRMNEGDLAQFCVEYYLSIVKSLRTLPEDTAYGLEESVAQLRT
jgi:hypothetical protein